MCTNVCSRIVLGMPGKKPTTQSFQQRLFCKTTTKLKKEGKSSRQMFLHSPTNFPTNSLFVSIIIQARFHPTFIDSSDFHRLGFSRPPWANPAAYAGLWGNGARPHCYHATALKTKHDFAELTISENDSQSQTADNAVEVEDDGQGKGQFTRLVFH